MTVEIEVARPADAEALAALHFLSHTVSFAPFASEDWLANRDLTDYVEQWRESLELAESDERACAWKAVSGGEIVGTVKVSPETSHEAQLGNMHVHPNFHRRGIGSALMSAAVRFMVSAGFSIAILGVIQANAAARAIYEKHGWTVRELRPTGVEGVPVAIYEIDLKAWAAGDDARRGHTKNSAQT